MKTPTESSVAETPAQGQMQGVAAVALGSASSTRDITEDEEYEKFVESMVQHCRCTGQPRPCDGVLAGGLCDNIQDDDCGDGHEPETCPTCHGSGQYDDCTPCPDCDGDGTCPW